MIKTRFISDLHLDESRPDLCQGFFDYLDRIIPDTERLFILGDLFEAWIGDDDLSTFNTSIIKNLSTFTQSGAELYIMHGNRDFLLAENFARATGAHIIQDPYILNAGDSLYLLSHGDSFCTDDVDYQAFKLKIRSPETINFLLSQSLNDRKLLAESLRKDTQQAVESKSLSIMDVNTDTVTTSFANHKVKLMIHGHTHRPAIHTHCIKGEDCRRFVLGDWQTHGYEIVLDNKSLQLVKFNLKDQHDTHTED